MSKDKVMDISEDDDFGFSFANEDEVASEAVSQDMENLKERLRTIRKNYLPLLQNLNKNHDKEMIKWPNRKEVLDKQIERLLKLTEV